MRTLSHFQCFSCTATAALVVLVLTSARAQSQQSLAAEERLQQRTARPSATGVLPEYAQVDKQFNGTEPNGMSRNAEAAADLVNFEPFQVFVAHANAYAHCGPSDEYYRTDPLRFGQTLEVYTETADGWLGIRPPADSFCWLPAETVQLDSAGELGTVVEDRTVSWIGTQLGRARQYRWQVQLAKGEQVTVIGRSEREGPDGPQLWLRIVPPSGEYRWVHRDSVVSSTEQLVELAQRSANRSTIGAGLREPAGAAAQNAGAAIDPILGGSVLEPSRPVGSGVRQVAGENQVSGISQDRSEGTQQTAMDVLREDGLLASLEFMTRPRIQDIGAQPQTNPSRRQAERVQSSDSLPESRYAANDSNWVSGRSREPLASTLPRDSRGNAIAGLQEDGFRASSRSMQNQNPVLQVGATSDMDPVQIGTRVASLREQVRGANVNQLNLLLSRLMAMQASHQEIAVVSQAAAGLASSVKDTVESQRASLVVETAQRYQRLAQRRAGGAVAVAGGTRSMNHRDGGVMTASSTVSSQDAGRDFSTSSSKTAALPTQGDVIRQVGYLVEVYSARSNSPPYALTDSAGRTVAYLSPMPGVNLRSLLNQQVGVVGSIGSVAGIDTPHLMVTQAIRMDQ